MKIFEETSRQGNFALAEKKQEWMLDLRDGSTVNPPFGQYSKKSTRETSRSRLWGKREKIILSWKQPACDMKSTNKAYKEKKHD